MSDISISYFINYTETDDKYSRIDRLGGIPTHLPNAYPRCNLCQEKMAFIAQIYHSDIFDLRSDNIALHFYKCEESCNLDVGLLIHVEAIPASALENTDKLGVESKTQSLLAFNYEAKEDPVNQWTFIKNGYDAEFDEELYYNTDKVNGLFPQDPYECPKITKDNLMIAQFLSWESTESESLYLYHTTGSDYYLHLYS